MPHSATFRPDPARRPAQLAAFGRLLDVLDRQHLLPFGLGNKFAGRVEQFQRVPLKLFRKSGELVRTSCSSGVHAVKHLYRFVERP